jgi:chromosome partitioning protein
MTAIIAVSNNKGGVAKTTTCFSLGACLAELGHRTLVVDLDPQADLTMAAGLNADALTWSVADWLASDAPTAQGTSGVYLTAMDKLYILPSNPHLASVERMLYERPHYREILKQKLARWNSVYDYILLDCPPALGGLVFMAYTAAQSVIIPVQCEYYAARRLTRLLDMVELVRKRTNPSLISYLLPTMYDQRTRISRKVLAQLQANFSEQLLDTVIGVDTRLRECPAVGEPIVIYAPRTRASEQYRQLAQELMAKWSVLDSAESVSPSS